MTITISVKAIAGAKKEGIVDNGFDELGRKSFKIKVAQPPENGKANRVIIKLIADHFKVKSNDVVIINGELSNHKIIQIKNYDQKNS